MRQVKISPGGIRGTVDDGLDLEQVIDLVGAFSTWINPGPVLLVQDTRPSSVMLHCAVVSTLLASGREVLDGKICPTAVAQYEAARRGVSGMISITGAHNEISWNGLKLFGSRGQVLSSAEGREVLDLLHQGEFSWAGNDQLGSLWVVEDICAAYIDHLRQAIDTEAIGSAGFRVVVDACNGAVSGVIFRLCEELGIGLIPFSCEPSGMFPHLPDPTPTNLAQAAAIIGPVGAHAGFGFSSDGERVGMITERGIPLGRKATFPLVADWVLADRRTPRLVIAGATCDSRIYRVAEKHGAAVSRCGVGVQPIVERMQLEGAGLGGDNSGGVAVKRLQLGYDGLGMMVLLLEAMAEHGGAQQLFDVLPRVHLRSLTEPCLMSRAYSTVARVREEASGKVSDLDGVHVVLEGGWYHVRVSHTEPVIRITCEADSEAMVDELAELVRSQVRRALWG